jgi:hypothetical protein
MKYRPPWAPVTVTWAELTPAGTVKVSDPTESYVHVVPDSTPDVPHGEPAAADATEGPGNVTVAEAASPTVETAAATARRGRQRVAAWPAPLGRTTR